MVFKCEKHGYATVPRETIVIHLKDMIVPKYYIEKAQTV